ncbi:ATP-binding protein, partial [Kurthia huakuii]|nr:putative HTH transcriptional regulator [Kurthia huakuii]
MRQQKPVSVNENPYIGTYRRNFEGDYRCSKEEVDNMIAESSNITRDSIVLDKYSFDDLDKDSFKRYRQRFAVRNPSHIWNELDDIDFLRRIGGWDKDREKKVEGLTAAGLLVFGQEMNITSYFHNYFLDYREHVNEYEDQRWSNRFTSQNGEWSGNLYDFYNKVIARINEDLKVPFKIDETDLGRVSDTDLHKALREALLNTIIHADYFTKGNIIVEKNKNEYKFINPGLLRIPLEKAIGGGTSDARNKNIFKIFSLLGLGERSGFGLENIHNTWKKYQWELPSLEESFKPENITLLLKTTPIIDSDISKELKEIFSTEYDSLNPYELKLIGFLCFAIKKCRELQRKIQNVATRYFPYFLDNAFV